MFTFEVLHREILMRSGWSKHCFTVVNRQIIADTSICVKEDFSKSEKRNSFIGLFSFCYNFFPGSSQRYRDQSCQRQVAKSRDGLCACFKVFQRSRAGGAV